MDETCERCGREKVELVPQQHRPIWGYAAGALCDICYGWALCQHELSDEFEHRTSHPASGEAIPSTERMDVLIPGTVPVPSIRPACDLIHEDSFTWSTPSPSGSAAHVALWNDGSLTVCVEPDESRLMLSGPPREVLARLLALAYAAATMVRAYEVASIDSAPFDGILTAVRESTGTPGDNGSLYFWDGSLMKGYVFPTTGERHHYCQIYGITTQNTLAADSDTLCEKLHLLWHITAIPESKDLPLDECKQPV